MSTPGRNYADALPIGTKIGATVLGGALGQGGEGLVYLGEHPEFGSVVVKEFWPKHIVSRSEAGGVSPAQPNWQVAYRTGLQSFIETSHRLCDLPPHPNVVEALEVIEMNRTAYLVMRHLVGTPLSNRLESATALARERVGSLAADICSGLEHLHYHGLIHRDVSPDNIIMVEDRAVLIDLNAAKNEARQASLSLGTLVKSGYSPFEQYHESSASLDTRSDIYAASAVLIHAMTGRKPIPASNRMSDRTAPAHTIAALPEGSYPAGFIKAVEHGFALDPQDRPQSIAQWRKELDLPALAAWDGQKPPKSFAWRPAFTGALALAAFCAAGLLLWSYAPSSTCSSGTRGAGGPPCALASPVQVLDSEEASEGAAIALATTEPARPVVLPTAQTVLPEPTRTPQDPGQKKPNCRIETYQEMVMQDVPVQLFRDESYTETVSRPIQASGSALFDLPSLDTAEKRRNQCENGMWPEIPSWSEQFSCRPDEQTVDGGATCSCSQGSRYCRAVLKVTCTSQVRRTRQVPYTATQQKPVPVQRTREVCA